jgi:hypothetical protein
MTRRTRRGTGTKRPWHVFVRDIGPTFTYATEERARAKVAELREEYGFIVLTGPCPRSVIGWERTNFVHEKEPYVEVLTDGQGWVRTGQIQK